MRQGDLPTLEFTIIQGIFTGAKHAKEHVDEMLNQVGHTYARILSPPGAFGPPEYLDRLEEGFAYLRTGQGLNGKRDKFNDKLHSSLSQARAALRSLPTSGEEVKTIESRMRREQAYNKIYACSLLREVGKLGRQEITPIIFFDRDKDSIQYSEFTEAFYGTQLNQFPWAASFQQGDIGQAANIITNHLNQLEHYRDQRDKRIVQTIQDSWHDKVVQLGLQDLLEEDYIQVVQIASPYQRLKKHLEDADFSVDAIPVKTGLATIRQQLLEAHANQDASLGDHIGRYILYEVFRSQLAGHLSEDQLKPNAHWIRATARLTMQDAVSLSNAIASGQQPSQAALDLAKQRNIPGLASISAEGQAPDIPILEPWTMYELGSKPVPLNILDPLEMTPSTAAPANTVIASDQTSREHIEVDPNLPIMNILKTPWPYGEANAVATVDALVREFSQTGILSVHMPDQTIADAAEMEKAHASAITSSNWKTHPYTQHLARAIKRLQANQQIPEDSARLYTSMLQFTALQSGIPIIQLAATKDPLSQKFGPSRLQRAKLFSPNPIAQDPGKDIRWQRLLLDGHLEYKEGVSFGQLAVIVALQGATCFRSEYDFLNTTTAAARKSVAAKLKQAGLEDRINDNMVITHITSSLYHPERHLESSNVKKVTEAHPIHSKIFVNALDEAVAAGYGEGTLNDLTAQHIYAQIAVMGLTQGGLTPEQIWTSEFVREIQTYNYADLMQHANLIGQHVDRGTYKTLEEVAIDLVQALKIPGHQYIQTVAPTTSHSTRQSSTPATVNQPTTDELLRVKFCGKVDQVWYVQRETAGEQPVYELVKIKKRVRSTQEKPLGFQSTVYGETPSQLVRALLEESKHDEVLDFWDALASHEPRTAYFCAREIVEVAYNMLTGDYMLEGFEEPSDEPQDISIVREAMQGRHEVYEFLTSMRIGEKGNKILFRSLLNGGHYRLGSIFRQERPIAGQWDDIRQHTKELYDAAATSREESDENRFHAFMKQFPDAYNTPFMKLLRARSTTRDITGKVNEFLSRVSEYT